MANKWLTHVKATMKAHKGKSFGDVLKMAKKTYKKGKMSGGSEGGVASAPEPGAGGAFPEAAAAGGRRRSRRGRKSRRGTRRG
jgi:hypothetical protein